MISQGAGGGAYSLCCGMELSMYFLHSLTHYTESDNNWHVISREYCVSE